MYEKWVCRCGIGAMVSICDETISANAPSTGSDRRLERRGDTELDFNSRPRAESDQDADAADHQRNCFNPRSPHGERLTVV